MEHAKLLFQLILETNPEHKEPNLEKWANEFRLIRKRQENESTNCVSLGMVSASFLLEKNILSPVS